MWTWIDTYPAKTRMKIQNCVGKESGLLSVVVCSLDLESASMAHSRWIRGMSSLRYLEWYGD